jgi:hypothetical protein
MNPLSGLLPADYGLSVEPARSSTILKLLKQDKNLPEHKKKSLFEMLNSPEAVDHILVGVAGMAIARSAAHYAKLSKPARTLLTLAGFGLGNIVYNHLNERKHTTFDPHTGKSRILL